ncbi:glycoside hydrolase family 36 protein [Viridothelium virens]|uniref:Glycoside hydrolase family 36 protein n=1 Tax=Viridothelium virens TaxID=1048519 RepID=A0A6A6HBV6_VIRVR|nr:glycoside hydrolase family 36 protein [Viridothelium virens]
MLLRTATAGKSTFGMARHAPADRGTPCHCRRFRETRILTLKSVTRRWFTANLDRKDTLCDPTSFTIRFRTNPTSSWKWVNDQSAVSDGQLLWQTSSPANGDLSYYIHGLSSKLNIKSELSETPDTLLWSVAAAAPVAHGQSPGFVEYKLGRPTNFTRWFSTVRQWTPWMAPRHGKYKWYTDNDAMLCSFLRHDGYSVVMLAVSGVRNVTTTFNHDGDGHITIRGSNDREQLGPAIALVAVAKSFDVANASVMYKARRMIMDHVIEQETQAQKPLSELHPPSPQWIEEWYDGLTYCTWNGLGIKLSEASILKAIDSLRNDGVQIANLIIDDNWQSLDHPEGQQYDRRWLNFEANKEGFPNGLRGLTDKIRNDWKNQKLLHIAVWHSIVGYWGGISPDGSIAQNYKTITVPKKPGEHTGEMLVVDEQDVYRFYNDFYSFLADSRIDSVKTDAQFLLDEIASAPARRSLINNYLDSWTITQLRYFAGRAISCMSLSPPIIFHSLLPTNRPQLLLRNSDDFYPDEPASHPWHIFCNAHNALLTQHLNVIPDWDMFQTAHPWGSFHAAARCVSGGPIYITDVPGEHDIGLIQQMTVNTSTERTRILRPDIVGKATQVYTGYDEEALLKVGTYVGRAHTGTGILGIFNVSQKPLTELLRLDEFPGIGVDSDSSYVIRAHTSGEVSEPMSLAKATRAKAIVSMDLPVKGWEILSAYPLSCFELGTQTISCCPHHARIKAASSVSVAVLGLVGKMTGAAAIMESKAEEVASGRIKVSARLKGLGVLGIYVSDLARWMIPVDIFVTIYGRPVPAHTVKVSEVAKNVVEIDVERAWKETDQQARWSNEVEVETFFNIP